MPYDEATLTKLEIFEQYLVTWLPVFIHTPHTSKAIICDFCAGSGYDSIDTPGSPIRIVKRIDDYRDQIFQNDIHIDILLNDVKSKKYRELKNAVAETAEFRGLFPDINPDEISAAKHEDIHRVMLEYYKQKIPEGNPTNLYPFTLKKGANIYGLVFGSKHPLGVEKFLDLVWDQNKINGEANFDIDDDIKKQHPTLFPEMKLPTKREVFEAHLEYFINSNRHGEVTNRDVYFFTLAHGHPKSHARECVIRLKKEGKVEYKGNIGFSYGSCVKNPPRTIKVKTNG